MSCFFSAFLGIYKGRFAPKIVVFTFGKTIGKRNRMGKR